MKQSKNRSSESFPIRARWTLAFGALFLFHFLRVLQFIPIHTFASPNPLIQGEHTMAYTETRRYIDFRETSGKTGGIETRLMDRVEVFPLIDSDIRLITLLSSGLRKFIDPLHSTKIIFFLLLALGPLFIFLAARRLSDDKKLIFLILALSVAGFGNFDYLSPPLIYNGHAIFLFSTYFLIFLFSVLFSICNDYKVMDSLIFIVGMSVLLLMQGVGFVISLFCIGSFLIFRSSDLEKKHFIVVSLAIIVSLLTNYFWIKDFFVHINTYSPQPWPHYSDQVSLLIGFLNPFSKYGFDSGALIRAGLILFVLYSAIRQSEIRKSWEIFFYFLFLVAVYLACLGEKFSWSETFRTNRYFYVMSLALIFPVANYMREKLWNQKSLKFILIGWVLFFQLTWPLAPTNKIREIQYYFPPNVSSITEWIKNLDSNKRVLIEDNFDYYQYHRFLPFETNKEYIGIAIPTSPKDEQLKTSFSTLNSLGRPNLFGEYLKDLPIRDVLAFIDHFNIETIVTYSDESSVYFGRYPHFFRALDSPQPTRAFKVKSTS